MRGKSSTGLNVGGSSILVIFVLLCLTTFATLAMVSANADYRLTQKAALASTAYYDADARAEELLAQIDQAAQAAASYPSSEQPNFFMVQMAALGEGIDFVPTSSGGTVTYSVPLDDTQSLAVALTVEYASARCAVTQWKVVVTAPIASFGEEHMQLLQLD